MLVHTPPVSLGSSAPDFSLPDVDGNEVRRSDIGGERGLVVAFICNHCPYVKAIAKEIAQDATTLEAEGFGFVAIMPNDYRSYPSDSPEQMKEFSAQHKFAFPYLVDEEQSVAKAYGAVCTPDFFGIDAEGRIQYRGRLDNGSVKRPTERIAELVIAMRAIAEGRSVVTQNPSVGCSIKWRR